MTAQLSLLAFIILSLMATSALAATPQTLGAFGKWSAWSYTSAGDTGCFVYSKPEVMEPASLDHGDVSFFLRDSHDAATRTEASFQTGFAFAPNSDILAQVDNQAFHMVASANSAWLRSSGPNEASFLAALKSGRMLTIAALSQRGNKVQYDFSLDGITKAVSRMQQACP